MNMEFNSQICTSVEQSKRLLDLGLKPETADMAIWQRRTGVEESVRTAPSDYDWLKYNDFIPAWSLHRLLYCLMPNSVKDYHLAIYSGYVVTYDSLCGSSYEVCKDFDESLNIYDNIVDCIEWLISEGYFNREYLKQ